MVERAHNKGPTDLSAEKGESLRNNDNVSPFLFTIQIHTYMAKIGNEFTSQSSRDSFLSTKFFRASVKCVFCHCSGQNNNQCECLFPRDVFPNI